MFLRKTKGSLAGKLASKKYDIIIAQALSKLRECIDVLKTCFLGTGQMSYTIPPHQS